VKLSRKEVWLLIIFVFVVLMAMVAIMRRIGGAGW